MVHLGVLLIEGFVSLGKLQNKYLGNFEEMKIPQYVTLVDYRKKEYTRLLLFSVKNFMMWKIKQTGHIYSFLVGKASFFFHVLLNVYVFLCVSVLRRIWTISLVSYLGRSWLSEVYVHFENFRLFNGSPLGRRLTWVLENCR